MSGVDLAERETPDGLGLKDALVWRRWHSMPVSRARAVTVCLALVLLVPVHVAMVVVADNTWSLLGVGLNPLVVVTYLWGWGHRDVLWVAIALVLALVGNFAPFYLM